MIKKMPPRSLAVPFLAAAALTGLAVPLLLPLVSQQPQVYRDLILDTVSLQNLNKSGELRLLWSLVAAAAFMAVLWHFHMAKREMTGREKNFSWNGKIVLLILVPALAHLLFLSVLDRDTLLLAALALALSALGLLSHRNILLLIVLYFSVLALRGLTEDLGLPHIQLRLRYQAALVMAVILFLKLYARQKAVWPALLGLQIPIPFILLYFLHNQYDVNGELTTVEFDPGYRFIVLLGLAAAVLHALYRAYAVFRENTRGRPPLDELILPTTVLSIFMFNNVNSPHPFIYDWHHSAENFVLFEQVVDFGKTLYGDVLSASGCYPLAYAFLQRFPLENTVASYFQAETLLRLLSFAASGLLLLQAFGRKCALFVTLALTAGLMYATAARTMFLLPAFLILMVPRIVANRHLWLRIYIFCALLLGLYYPLYGAAYLLGGLPFALARVINIFAAKEEARPKLAVWGWGALLAALLFFSPLLLRVARYILMMASQTVLTDGVALYDHVAPAGFLAWVTEPRLNRFLYFCAVHGLHAFCVLRPLSLCLIYLFNYKKNDKFTSVQFLAFSFGVLSLPVVYTYSVVRMDYGGLLFRTGGPLAVVSIVLLGSLWRYGGAILTRKSILVCFSFLLTLNYVFSTAAPPPYTWKFFTPFPAWIEDDSWQLPSADLRARFPRLGDVFLRQLDIERMDDMQTRLEKISGIQAPILDLGFRPEPPAIDGIPASILNTGYKIGGQLGYFLFGREASVTGTTHIFKSTAAQRTAIEIMERDLPVCFGLDSVEHYVLYRRLMEPDYVVSNGAAVPKSKAGPAFLEAVPDYSIFNGFDELGNRPNALGKSLTSLRPLFDERPIAWRARAAERAGKTLTLALEFERKIPGREVDFIFLGLANENRPERPYLEKFFALDDRQFRYSGYSAAIPPRLRVRAAWAGGDGLFEEKNSMSLAFGDGRLLLPLGANPGWLNGEAGTLKLEISGDWAEGETVSLEEVKFLRFKPTFWGRRPQTP